jgi:hypothetical protein
MNHDKMIFTILLASGLCACGLKIKGELPADGSSSCDPGQTLCDDGCVDTQTDRSNCGSCGNVCTDPLAECVGGQCRCADPFVECGGHCVDTRFDKNNCGSCGDRCDDMATCENGVCKCASGFTDCSGSCVNTDTDNQNCGSCGNACVSPKVCNGSGMCAAECESGYTLCDEAYCADTLNDPLNCGGCHNACPAGHAIPECRAGVCYLNCDANYVDLNRDIADGCECHSTPEICNNYDDDCNGSPDDIFTCTEGEIRNCTEYGSCTGLQQCVGPACEWNSCSNPAWNCYNPGGTEGCGNCGTRTCSSSCQWGPCVGEGCSPGSTQPCGRCNSGTKTCTSSCTWGACAGETGCSPGSTQPCGRCNSGTQTCTSSCTWGACAGETGCSPGSTQPCGRCNSGTQTCTSSCTWGACAGETGCSPGSTQPCGRCNSGTQICNSSCTWDTCTGEVGCVPGSTQCYNPPGNDCIQTCQPDCTWSCTTDCTGTQNDCLNCSGILKCCDTTCGDCL